MTSRTILDLNRDVLQCIALQLDTVSLVSFSLVCNAFRCNLMPPKDENGDSRPRTWEGFGILGIPNVVYADGLCIEAVRNDLPEAFDYWSTRVKLNPRVVGNMLTEAGILQIERGMFWVGKIHIFMFSNPWVIKLDDSWTEFVNGIIISDDAIKYMSIVYPTTIGSYAKEHLSIHFKKAITARSFKLAELLAETLHPILVADYPELQSTFLHDGALKYASDHAEGMKWFLDRIPINITIAAKTHKLNHILHISPSDTMVMAIGHPLFAEVPDVSIIIPHATSQKTILNILDRRPTLDIVTSGIYTKLLCSNEFDARAIKYVPRIPASKMYKALIDNFSSINRATLKRLLELFPLRDYYTGELLFDRVFRTLGFKDAVKLFSETSILGENLLMFLKKKYLKNMGELIGTDIFPDDVIVQAIRDALKSV